MDRIGDQGDGAGEVDDDCLGQGGDKQRDEADLQRADSSGAGFQGRVHRVRGVVAVRAEQGGDPPLHPTRLVVPMAVSPCCAIYVP